MLLALLSSFFFVLTQADDGDGREWSKNDRSAALWFFVTMCIIFVILCVWAIRENRYYEVLVTERRVVQVVTPPPPPPLPPKPKKKPRSTAYVVDESEVTTLLVTDVL